MVPNINIPRFGHYDCTSVDCACPPVFAMEWIIYSSCITPSSDGQKCYVHLSRTLLYCVPCDSAIPGLFKCFMHISTYNNKPWTKAVDHPEIWTLYDYIFSVCRFLQLGLRDIVDCACPPVFAMEWRIYSS